jgi:hypothetical protein
MVSLLELCMVVSFLSLRDVLAYSIPASFGKYTYA